MHEATMRTFEDDDTTQRFERETPSDARPVMLHLAPWVRALLPMRRRLVPRGL